MCEITKLIIGLTFDFICKDLQFLVEIRSELPFNGFANKVEYSHVLLVAKNAGRITDGPLIIIYSLKRIVTFNPDRVKMA